MKENILKIIETTLTKDYFLDMEIELTVNYKKVYGGDYREPILLKNVIVSDIDKILTDIGEIKGYNFSLKGDRGCNGGDDEEKMFDSNWKDNTFTFWSGKADDDDILDTLKYGKFEWRTLGNRESFDSNGIRSKLWRPDFKSNEREALIDGNYFEYNKVGEKMDLLHELDILLDKHQEEKVKIYNKLKLKI